MSPDELEPLVEWNGLWLPRWKVEWAERLLAEEREREDPPICVADHQAGEACRYEDPPGTEPQ